MEAITSGTKLAIRLNATDNVAVAMDALQQGDLLSVFSEHGVEVDRVIVATPVPLPFHKVALVPISRGAPLIKYGEIIGYATAPIGRGAGSYTHNLESATFGEGEDRG